ncbi:MAG: monovalent cation/H+ antiporter complex subunit F [Desulfobacteraceae bacterium]|jgi:multicomponent Na+:H+ antiporter subunit F
MENVILYSGIALAVIMAVSLYRTVVGPTILDRLMGVNAIGSETTVLLIIIGILYKKVDMFIDIALAYALLNFIAVLASARYFHKKKDLYDEHKDQ